MAVLRWAIAALILAGGCKRQPPASAPAAPPPGPPQAAEGPVQLPSGPEPGSPAGAQQTPGGDAAPPALAPAPLALAIAVAAGADSPLRRDGESAVEPAAHFVVDVAVPLSDGRLSLFDGQELLVPAEAVTEIGTSSSRFTLSPAQPLRPTARYTLRLEGASTRELHDLAGNGYRPISLALLVTGDPPLAEPPRKAKSKRRHRRR